jgi:hypothetical protein
MLKCLRLPLVAALVLSMASSGCGLMFYSEHQMVDVVTNPDGATIRVDGVPHEQLSPTQIKLHRKTAHQIDATLPDGSTGSTFVGKRLIIPVVIMDACTLGIGLLIDYLLGSMYQLDTPVRINLGKSPAPLAPTPTVAPTPTGPSADAAPCGICGEPRGDANPCPHCGME